MAYNKARAEKQWLKWKEAEERRKLEASLRAKEAENNKYDGDDNISDNIKDVLQVYQNISEYYNFLEAAVNEQEEKNKVSERDYGVEDNTNSGLNLEDGLQKNKAESDNKKDGSNLGKSDIAGENITAGDG